jgi:tetratricopeptide (TPR) repeat protein
MTEPVEVASHGGVRLTLDTVRLPMTPIGEPDPLPPLAGLLDPPFGLDTLDVPDDIRRGMAYGQVDNLAPYLHQDGYDRDRHPASLPVTVLENDLLRASIALGLGGRIWSLEHKPSGRELVYRNRVLQPANFALRNAWFSGGIEWNIGTRGHSPTTCAPVHAAVVVRPDGTPMVRMWQWERLREVTFQVDVWLEGELLLAYVRIHNPNDAVVPMYWWSNVAVAETPETRVLAPARSAYRTSYDGCLATVPIPVADGLDATYPARSPGAADLFFAIAPEVQPWIAALDADGRGLLQTSTMRLRGRKLFVWGQSTGGRHWQEWLSGGGAPYLEIQAGLATTQHEHLPMPARAEWSWVEAYGMAAADPAATHGADWDRAVQAGAAEVRRLASPQRLDAALAAATALADWPPGESLSVADGWGALERRRRASTGEPPPGPPGAPYADASLTGEQRPFGTLLETGDLPDLDPARPPLGYVVGPDWSRRLAAAVESWASRLHLGVVAHAAGDLAAARDAYERSLRLSRTPWALRNLALLGGPSERAELLVEAHRLAPDLWQLAVEAAVALLGAGRAAAALALIDAAPAPVRAHGRSRLLTARAALAIGDVDRAAGLLDQGVEVADLREGEIALHELWWECAAHRLAAARDGPVDDAIRDEARQLPVPARYDFRMRPD